MMQITVDPSYFTNLNERMHMYFSRLFIKGCEINGKIYASRCLWGSD